MKLINCYIDKLINCLLFVVCRIVQLQTSNLKPLLSIFLFVSLCLCGNNSYSQDSLSSYLEMATENNPLLKSKYNDYLSALEKIPQVSSLPDPEFSAGYYLEPMEVVSGKQIADLKLMQMFPWWGTFKSSKAEALSMANMKLSSYNEAKLEIQNKLKSVWYQLYSNKKEIDYSNETIDILKSLENITLGQYQNTSLSGSAVKSSSSTVSQNSETKSSQSNDGKSGSMGAMNSDSPEKTDNSMDMQTSNSMGKSSGIIGIFNLQLEVFELESNISLLKDQQKTLVAQFNSLLNRDLSANISISDTLDNKYNANQAYIDSIKANNPMVQMLEFEKQSYENKIQMSKKMGLPMVGVGLNYSIIGKSKTGHSTMNGKDMIMPMLTVSLPIYRKKYNAMVKESELMISSTDDRLTNTKNELEVEYIKALEGIKDAERRIKLSIAQQDLTERSLNLLVSQYSTSGSGFDEVLRLQIQHLKYKIQASKALTDYNIAVAMLEKLIN